MVSKSMHGHAYGGWNSNSKISSRSIKKREARKSEEVEQKNWKPQQIDTARLQPLLYVEFESFRVKIENISRIFSDTRTPKPVEYTSLVVSTLTYAFQPSSKLSNPFPSARNRRRHADMHTQTHTLWVHPYTDIDPSTYETANSKRKNLYLK